MRTYISQDNFRYVWNHLYSLCQTAEYGPDIDPIPWRRRHRERLGLGFFKMGMVTDTGLTLGLQHFIDIPVFRLSEDNMRALGSSIPCCKHCGRRCFYLSTMVTCQRRLRSNPSHPRTLSHPSSCIIATPISLISDIIASISSYVTNAPYTKIGRARLLNGRTLCAHDCLLRAEHTTRHL